MKPEDVFGSMSVAEWSVVLCHLLIRFQKEIKEYLQVTNKSAEFGTKISVWRQEFSQQQNWDWTESAIELFRICEECGVIEFIMQEGFLSPARCESVRTRGIRSNVFKELMENIVEIFKEG